MAACGSLLHPSRSPIEEDKMLRSFDLSILASRSWIPAAWVPGGQDPLISAAWSLGLAAMISSFGPCFEGWELEGTGCSRLGGVVSHARRSGEVGGYMHIYIYIYIYAHFCIFWHIAATLLPGGIRTRRMPGDCSLQRRRTGWPRLLLVPSQVALSQRQSPRRDQKTGQYNRPIRLYLIPYLIDM